MRKILVIDDNVELLEVLEYQLEAMGLHVETASTSVEGVVKARTNKFDIIMVDYFLENGVKGDTVIEQLRHQLKDVRYLIITGCLDVEDVSSKVIHKPFVVEELEKWLAESMSQEQVNTIFHDFKKED